MKEVTLCSTPGGCCAKVEIHAGNAVTIKSDMTSDEVYLTADEWAALKAKIISGEL